MHYSETEPKTNSIPGPPGWHVSAAASDLLFESNPQPMWIVDHATLAFLAVNQAAIRQYGYSREEFLRMTALDLETREAVHPSCSPVSRDSVRGLRQAETATHRKKDRTLMTVELSSNFIDLQGVDAMLVSARDMTDAVRREQQLRQSEERFSLAFRSSPMAITISTLAEGRYIDVNDAFLRMIGRERDEVVGRTAFELDVWEVPEDRMRVIAELERSGAVRSFDNVIHSRTRGCRSVQISAGIIQLDGIPCVLGITDDVTEAKAMEEHLRQAQKMEAMGRLAGGIAHDFSNMLGVIIGYCDLASSRSNRDIIKNDVAHIKKAAERANRLTSQLLAFGRRQMLRPSVLNLNTAVKDLLEMLHRVISSDTDLRFLPSPVLGDVKADLNQFEQILLNLVVNARDAMPHGGTITIETADLTLDADYARHHPKVRPGSYVVLSITDTGCGMSAETMLKIFEPFFSTKSPGKGTGLGLSMVYGALQQAGGHIAVFSEEGKGTTFKLYFPKFEEMLSTSAR